MTRPDTYALVLLDLDGVLVDTERLHFEAYRQAVAAGGRRLPWSFERYCQAAHWGSARLQADLVGELPGLLAEESDWPPFYSVKSDFYLRALAARNARLLPGALDLLVALAAAGRRSCVVTNSPREQVALLRRQLPKLELVDAWVVREDYLQAKPAPDAYRTALAREGVVPERAIGFEDTPRGLTALVAAGVPAVLVTPIDYPELARETWSPLAKIAGLDEAMPLLFD